MKNLITVVCGAVLCCAGFVHAAADVELISRIDPSNAGGAASGDTTGENSPYDEGRKTSTDGRFTVVASTATDLMAGQVNAPTSGIGRDIFIYDRQNNTWTLVSHAAGSNVTSANHDSDEPSVSDDGNYVAFRSRATDLVTGQVDTNNTYDFFLWERSTGNITLMSRSTVSATTAGNGTSGQRLAMSADGNYAVFGTTSSDLGFTDTNAVDDIILFTRSTGTLTLVSHAAGANTTAGSGRCQAPRISNDGRYVLYMSRSTNLVAGQSDTNADDDIFLWDRTTNTNKLISHANGSATTTANGGSAFACMTPDASFIAYMSDATNLLTSALTQPAGRSSTVFTPPTDIYLYTVATDTTVLCSHAFGSVTTTGNDACEDAAISGDGSYVAFRSWSTDLLSGQVDPNDGTMRTSDVFIYKRSDASVTMVTRKAGTTVESGAGAKGFPTKVKLKLDGTGKYLIYSSPQTNLVSGQSDTNNAEDVFLYDTTAGTSRILSRANGSSTTTANGNGGDVSINFNGTYAYFTSTAPNITNAPDANGQNDLFVHDIAANTNALCTNAAGALNLAAGSGSGSTTVAGVSGDGRYIVYLSSSTGVIAGQVDSNGGQDVFLYDRVARTTTLVSHAASSTTTTANGTSDYPVISRDGSYVVFESNATNLVTGQVDSNSGQDIFLWERATNTTKIVSHKVGAPAQTGNNTSISRCAISGNGRYVVFRSFAADLITGFVDNAGLQDIFLYDRVNDTSQLISHAAGNNLQASNGLSQNFALSDDGDWVVFLSSGSNIAPNGDVNGGPDVFLWKRTDGSISVVNHFPGDPLKTHGNSAAPTNMSISSSVNGVFVALDLLHDYTGDGSGGRRRMYLYSKATESFTLISHAASGTNTVSNNDSRFGFITNDGRYVLYNTYATDLVSGITDTNAKEDVYLWDRTTNTNRLISHIPGSATTTGDADSVNLAPAIADDGSYVVLRSQSTNLVPGQTDLALTDDIFLYNTATNTMILCSHSTSNGTTTANGPSDVVQLSTNGETCVFISRATDLVPDDKNSLWDVYTARLPVCGLGNRVFNDINNNGLLDAGELGIAGVSVNLYQDVNGNGTLETGTDTLIGTTTTDASGFYRFDFLFSGTYIVQIPQSNFNAGNPLNTYISSTFRSTVLDPGVETDPDDDVDNNDSGRPVAGLGVVSGAVTLNAGTEPTNDGDNFNTNMTIDFGFSRPADLSLGITVDNATPIILDNVVFTLTLSNAGPGPATGVKVEDILPAGLSFVSANPAAQFNSATGIWTVPTVNSGSSATMQITAKVDNKGVKVNSVQVSDADQYDPDSIKNNGTANAEDDRGSQTITPLKADISVTMSADDSTPVLGTNMVFTITAANAGPSPAYQVVVTDLLPAGLTYVSHSTLAGTYNSTTGAWSAGTIASGASATLQITCTMATLGTKTNTAELTSMLQDDPDSTPGNGLASEDDQASMNVRPAEADLSLSLAVDNATPNKLQNIVYTLTVSNAGPDTATGVVVQHNLPAGLTIQSVNPAAEYNTGTGVWTLGSSVAASGTKSLQITARVDTSAAKTTTAQITAHVEYDPDSTPNNGVGNAEDDRASITVTPRIADLSLGVTTSNATPNINENFIYSVTITNDGPSNATGVVVNDLLPAGVSFVSASPAIEYNSATGVWSAGTVNVGAPRTLQITARATTLGAKTNTAEITAADQFDSDSTPANGTSNGEDDYGSVAITPQSADLSLGMSVNNATPNVGDNVIFTLTLTNAGPDTATNIQVKNTLPAGMSFVSANPAAAFNSGTGIWSVASLGITSTTLQITAQVTSTGTKTNSAEVFVVDQYDTDSTPNNDASEDDKATASLTPQVADLSLSMSVDVAAPNVNDNVTFTLTVANAGPDAASNVVVRDILPGGLSFVSANPSANYNSGTGMWTVGALGSSASSTLTITAKVTTAGAKTNTAEVFGVDQADSDSVKNNNNAAEDDQASSTVTPLTADLSVGLTVDNATPNVNDNVIFTLSVTNAGPNNATGVVVTLPLPGGLSFVASNSGSYNSTNGQWSVGNLNSSQTTSITVTAKVTTSGAKVAAAEVTAVTQHDPDSTPGNGANAEDDYSSATVTPQVADLSANVTVTNATPNVGNSITFTLTVLNSGPNAATNVTATVSLPAGLTFSSANPAASYNSGTGLWSIGTINSTATATLQITTVVATSGTKTLSFEVAAADQYDSDSTPNNGAAEDDLANQSITPQVSDLSLGMTVDSAAPNLNQNITFTLTVSNAGPDAASNVAVVNTFPTGLSFVSANPAAAYNSGTNTWTVGAVASGGTASIQLTAKVTSPDPQTNSAEITFADQYDSDSTPNNGANEDDKAASTITPQRADLSLTMSVSNAAPNVGDNVTFTLTLTNGGVDAATNIQVGDVLPAGLSFVSANPAADYNSGTGVWTVASLAAGNSATLQLTAQVTSIGTKTNTAEVVAVDQHDPDSTPNNGAAEDDRASASLTPQVADLSLNMSVNVSNPNVGDNVTFTLTLNNAGPDAASSVVVNNTLPAGMSFVSANPAAAFNSGTGQWTVGGLAASGSASLQITALVLTNGTKTNVAEVSAVDQADSDSTENNNVAAEDDQASASLTPQEADLNVSVSVDNASPNVGDTIKFTVTVQNSGPDAADNIVITDLLPAGLTFVSANPAGNYNSSNGQWSITNLPAGNTATLEINATVATSGAKVNTAEVTGVAQYDPDSTPNNGAAAEDDIASVTVTPQVADLSSSMSVDFSTPNVGDTITFTLTVQNAGPNAATNVEATCVLPAGLTFVSASPAASYNSSTGLWTIGTINATSSASLQISALVATAPAMTASFEVTDVDQYDSDSTPNNAAAAEDDLASVTVTPQQADLSLSMTVDVSNPLLNTNVTFTLTVSNGGPDAANNVAVQNTLPPGLTFVSANPSAAFNDTTGMWTVGNVASGATATLEITATVNSPVAQTNSAEITAADQYDPDSTPNNGGTEDDSASSTITTQQTDLSLTLTASTLVPNVGDNVTFTLTLSNSGPDAASSVLVNAPLPAGLTFVSAAPSAAYNSSNGLWTAGTLAANASTTLQITAAVANSGAKTLTAEVSAEDQYDPDSTPNNGNGAEDDQSSITLVPQIADLSLSASVSSQTPNVGDIITLTLTLSNGGPDAATNVAVAATLPAGMTFVSASPSTEYNSTTGTWSRASISAGAAATLAISAKVTAPAAITSSAQVAAVDQYDPDSTPNNSVATEDDQASYQLVPEQSDLSLTLTASALTANANDKVDFVLTVTNKGKDNAAGVVVTAKLPAGIKFESADAPGYDSSTGVWTVGALALNGSSSLSIQTTVQLPGAAVFSAEITEAVQFDPDSTPGNGVGKNEDDEASVTLSVSNIDPKILSGPTATPSTLAVLQKSSFQISASDPNGDALTYAWVFGDGASSSEQNPVHAFTVPGTYTVSVTVTDTHGAKVSGSVSVRVYVPITSLPGDLDGDSILDNADLDRDGDGFDNAMETASGSNPNDPLSFPNAGGLGNSFIDSDGDFVPDEIEANVGTNPFSAASTPVTNELIVPRGLALRRLHLYFNFSNPGTDTIYARGLLPKSRASLEGRTVIVDIGGVTKQFTLNGRGRATTATGDIFALMPKKGSEFYYFTVRFLKGIYAPRLADEQMINTSVTAVPRVVKVSIIFMGQPFQSVTTTTYSSTGAGTGQARLRKEARR